MHRFLIVMLAAAAWAADPSPKVALVDQPLDILVTAEGAQREGTLIEKFNNGTSVRFKLKDAANETVYPAGSWKDIIYRRPAAKVFKEAVDEARTLGSPKRMVEVLQFGIGKGLGEQAAASAGDWLKQRPGDRQVLAAVLPLWRERGDWAAIESAARAGLKADANWAECDELIIEALTRQERQAELQEHARQWLERQPSALRANLICGAAYETAGEVRKARECFRKAWELHKHTDGALGFARCSLKSGNFADTVRAAGAVSADPAAGAEARAYAGAAQAALGDGAAAKASLDGLAIDALPTPAAQAAGYALGLLAFRDGRMAEAARLWQGVKTPAAQFAAAIALRQEFASADRLGPEHAVSVRLLNAAVRLETGQAAQALPLIDARADARQSFLAKAAEILASNGAPAALRAIQGIATRESERWQVYGHLRAGRFAEAEALARTLPPDDGYAAACLVYLAAARQDEEGARNEFEKAQRLPGAPADYIRVLSDRYSSAADTVVTIAFDWPPGDQLASGWEPVIPLGSGIGLRATGDRLVMEGNQGQSSPPAQGQPGPPDGATRAMVTVPGARFRLAQLAMDVSAATAASVGLELLDGSRMNGIAVGTRPGSGNLHWRLLRNGRWEAWIQLPYRIDAGNAVIAVDLSGGTVFASDPVDRRGRTALSDILAGAVGEWRISLFGLAEAGAAWKASFSSLTWRLKPE